jgi:hypothetical protein
MKKVLISIAVVFVLLIAAVVAIPFIFKDKINAKVKTEINNNLNAKVDYGDFGLTLIKSFPDFTLTLSDFSVTGINEFKGDTLAFIKDFEFTIDIMSVIKGEKIIVKKVLLSELLLSAVNNFDGKANWDIVKPSKEKTSSSSSGSLSLQIRKYQIQKSNISYNDFKGKTYAAISNLNFEGSGNVTDDNYTFKTKTNADEVSVKSGGVPYLSKVKLSSVFDVDVDSKNSKYTFGENDIRINDLQLLFTGNVSMPKEDIGIDVSFKSPQSDFKNILSLIPAIYKKDFDKIKTSGKLALDGKVKGIYNDKTYPSINLNLKVDNAMFQYPSLPTAVRNINIVANISKPEGSLDFTKIDVSKFHLEAGNEPIDAKIKVITPISNPDVDATVHGKLDLANVSKFYPLEGVKKLEGLITADLDFRAKQKDLEAKNYGAVKAEGKLDISNLVYDATDAPMPIRVNTAKFTFNPQTVDMSNLIAVIGKSDFRASGTLANFMAYAFGQGELKGRIDLHSNVFDANEFLKPDPSAANGTAKKDTPSTQFFKVPALIDFTANSDFGKILYDKLILSNVKGTVLVKDEAINLQNLFANLLGGSATISGKYDTKNSSYPKVNFTYDIKNFDFQETYKFAGMAEKIAPIIKHVQGNFSSDMKGSGSLNPDMSLDYKSLNGEGKVEIASAKIVDVPLLNEINKLAKIPALQNLELKNGWTVLKFKDGKVFVDPTDFKFGNGYNMNVLGSNSFDNAIDYTMRLDVPSSQLGAATSVVQNMIPKVPGINFTMPDVVNFFFKATGSMEKPKLTLQKVGAGNSSAKDMAKQAIEDLKAKAEEEARKKADELKQQAEAEIQKQKANAEQQAKDAAQKAKQDAERQAKEAAEKAKKEAEKKAKDIFKFPK